MGQKKKDGKTNVKSDLTVRLRTLVKNKRVGVFIDAANLYYSASIVGIHIDFETISEWFSKHAKDVNLNFYTAYDLEDENQLDFLDSLIEYGYRVVRKPVKVFSNLRKGNMDVELAVDAILKNEEYDVCVLISGDGDFLYLLNKLEELGKSTIVLGVGGFTSYELHKDANNYFFLDRIANVWRGKKREKQKKEYYVFIDQIEENDYNPDYVYPAMEFTAPQKSEKKNVDDNNNKNTRKTGNPKPKANNPKNPKVRVKVSQNKSSKNK